MRFIIPDKQAAVEPKQQFFFIEEQNKRFLNVMKKDIAYRIEIPLGDHHDVALHLIEIWQLLKKDEKNLALYQATLREAIFWLKPEWQKLSDDKIFWQARGYDSDSDSEDAKNKDQKITPSELVVKARERAGERDFKRYLTDFIKHKKLVGSINSKGQNEGQAKNLREELAAQSKAFLYSASSFDALAPAERKIAQQELKYLQAAKIIQSQPDGRIKVVIEKDQGKMIVKEEKILQMRFAFVSYRGVHYLWDRWNRQSWEAHRFYDERHRVYPAEAVWKTLDVGSSKERPAFYWRFKHMAVQLQDAKSELSTALQRNAEMLRGQFVNHLRGSWYVALKIHDQYKFFHNLSYAFNHIYSNGIAQYLELTKKLLEKDQQYFGALLPNPYNMLVSVADGPYHSSRYCFGWLKPPYSEYALGPDYFLNGRTFHPHVGKMVMGLHPLSDMLDVESPNHLLSLRLQNEASLRSNISHELEISFPAFIPANRIFNQFAIKYPSFNRSYKASDAEKYGMSQELYTLFSQAYAEVVKKTVALDDFLFLLTEWLCRFHTARAFLQVEYEARQRNVVIVYRDPIKNFVDTVPVSIKVSKAKTKDDFLSAPQRKKIAQALFKKHKTHPTSPSFKHYKVDGVYTKPLELLLVDENTVRQLSDKDWSKLNSSGVTLSGQTSPKTSPAVSGLKAPAYHSPSIADGKVDEKKAPAAKKGLSDLFAAMSLGSAAGEPSKKSQSEFKQDLLNALQEWGGELTQALAISLSLSEAQQKALTDEAKAYGYECKNMPGDGNCFFHAVRDQLVLIDAKYANQTHEKLREQAVAHIMTHIVLYRNFMGIAEDAFVLRIARDKEWADGLIITALARTYNITIVAIRSDGAAPNIVKPAHPIGTVYLGYEVGRHYQSLIRRMDWVATKNVQQYIQQAAVDAFADEKQAPVNGNAAAADAKPPSGARPAVIGGAPVASAAPNLSALLHSSSPLVAAAQEAKRNNAATASAPLNAAVKKSFA